MLSPVAGSSAEGHAARPPVRILVVEDDPDDARITFRALRRNGRFDPVHARTGAAALDAAAAEPFALGLVDYRLPDMSGVELVRRLRAQGLGIPLVILSAVQSDSIVARALDAGATDFLLKHLTYGDRLEDEVGRFLEA
ncbi:MAG TPA: response regulator [Candidatus Thermoplasmatota archaeon]|nr:response regulator [Candidatus Thermoplasmatota archaeon]